MTNKDDIEKSDWIGIVKTLEDVSDYYDRMNNLSTFFQAEKWRIAAATYSDETVDVLEIGCGPGSFASHLKGKKILCLDPSERLLKIAENRLGDKVVFSIGEAESLPADSNSFDRVFCSFSFRDFRNKRKSIDEMFRVLRNGGKAVILDITKYDRGIKSILMKSHLKHLVPLIATIVVPRNERMRWGRNPYRDLWKTYESFGTPDRFASMMREIGFLDVRIELLSLGGAFLLIGSKP